MLIVSRFSSAHYSFWNINVDLFRTIPYHFYKASTVIFDFKSRLYIVIGKLKQHHPHMVRWESNNGGDEYGGIVDEALHSEGVRINMSYKKVPTTQSKLSRIIQFAPDIKTSMSSMKEIEVLSMRNSCER